MNYLSNKEVVILAKIKGQTDKASQVNFPKYWGNYKWIILVIKKLWLCGREDALEGIEPTLIVSETIVLSLYYTVT